MKTETIRQTFLDFFQKEGHTVVPSSSLIPSADPTLLFVNSGMVQFKDTFLGQEVRPYTRASSVQRSVRAGGKHNDLDNVGFTARHHTFFEMLGNFSFGDYFKREAIHFAWKLLTQVFKIPAQKLWVTVYEEDQEAEDIWLKEIKVDPQRISRIGAKDNFWAMGDTGPCGPCTEIFYDHGPEVAGGPPGSPDADGDRYIEIWNLVFMQFNRDKSGKLHPLPKPCVDTGMGLERIAAVLQGVHDNYDIDLFRDLIQFIAKITGTSDLQNRSLRVIADHIRSTVFLMLDGVVPSNEGRGYVLRRIMRRALRQGHKLGVTEAFFYQLVEPLVALMGKAYPELILAKSRISEAILQEEQQFARTLSQGMKEFEAALQTLEGKMLKGETVFKLYDTYGFPLDLTEDMAKERGLLVDHPGFESCMNEQRSRAKGASEFQVDYNAGIPALTKTDFLGYHSLQSTTELLEIFKEGSSKDFLNEGEQGILVLAQSPFYAESGGQVGDKGKIQFEGGSFEVEDTQKQGEAILHFGKVHSGKFSVGTKVHAEVAADLRAETRRHHSATHLLHSALQRLLGAHVLQKGSLVSPHRLRFDFSYPKSITEKELMEIERQVNEMILENIPVKVIETSLEEAKKMGALALFGEKYKDQVRVIEMGKVSLEFCGGTHVSRTGDIGAFKIISESSVASGVRRIEALVGLAALAHIQHLEKLLKDSAELLKAPLTQIPEKISQCLERNAQLGKKISEWESQFALRSATDLLTQVEKISGISVLCVETSVEGKSLKDLALHLQEKLGQGIIVLANREAQKVNLVLSVSEDLVDKVHAGKLIGILAEAVGGKGGGRANFAQAGGTLPEKLKEALSSAKHCLQEYLK